MSILFNIFTLSCLTAFTCMPNYDLMVPAIDIDLDHNSKISEAIESHNIIQSNTSSLETIEYTEEDWVTGIASAYGGDTDSQVIDNQLTATGDAIDIDSMGVAIPMSWTNYKSYFGKHIYIKYEDVIIEAVVNDCGYLDDGTRALDLQPGIWKALGASTCEDWGLRQVEYRIL